MMTKSWRIEESQLTTERESRDRVNQLEKGLLAYWFITTACSRIALFQFDVYISMYYILARSPATATICHCSSESSGTHLGHTASFCHCHEFSIARIRKRRCWQNGNTYQTNICVKASWDWSGWRDDVTSDANNDLRISRYIIGLAE